MGRGADSDPYRRLFETMLDGAVVVDATTRRVVLANGGAARIFGFASADALVGLDPLDYVPAPDRARASGLLAESADRPLDSPIEVNLVTADQKEARVSVHAAAIEHQGRKAFLATFRDITAEKARDSVLIEVEQRYHRLFDGMLDGALVLDIATFQVALANRAAARMFGFDRPEDMVGQNPLDFIPEEDRSRIVNMIATNIEGKHKDPAELQVMTRDKRLIWVSATATEFHHDGRSAVITTMRDITAEKAKDAALRVAEESKMQLIEAASEAIYILQDGKIAYVNPAGARGAGLPQEDLVGLPFVDLVHPDSRQQVVERYEKISAGQFFPGLTTVKGMDARGQARWANIQEIPYSWQGRPAIMSLISDVTDRILAEQSLRHEEERLRAIMENAWDGVAIFDQDFRVMFESPSLAKMTGYFSEEWSGITPDKFQVHPDDLQHMMAQLELLRSRPGAVIQDVVIRYRHRDGSWRNMEAAGRNLLDDPKVNGMVINFRDITERQKAEEALKSREALLRAVVENAWDGVVVFDEEFRVVFESPTLQRITGYAPVEWTEAPPGQWPIHPDDVPLVLHTLDAIKEQPGSTVSNVRMRIQRKDGAWRWMEASATNLLHDPRLRGIVCNFRDITEAREAEESLRQSEALLRSTQDLAMVGGWDYDVETKQSHWTDETYRIHELPNLPDIDHPAESRKCYPPMDRQALIEAFQRCLDDGVPFDLVLPFMTFKGNRRWVRTTAKAIRDGDRTVRIVGNIADITERKSAEERLLASEERYRKVVETASEAIAVLQDGVIKYANPKTAAVSGYSVAELTLKPFLELVHPDDRKMVADYYVTKQRGREAPSSYQFRFVDKSGNTGWAEANVALLIWDGRLATLLLMNIITERKTIEEALKASEERFRTLIEESTDAIALLDASGKVLYQSPSMGQVTGYRPEDWSGSPVEDWFLHPDDILSIATAYESVLREPNATMSGLTARFKHADGTWHTLEATVRNLLHDPKVGGLVINYRDITERVKSQEALLASETNYKNLFEATLLGTEVIDAETGRVVLANSAVARIFGLGSAEEAIGINPMDYILPEDREWVAEQMAAAIVPGKRDVATVRSGTVDSRVVWLTATASSIQYHGRQAILVSMIDVTAMREAETKLRESEEKNRLLIENAAEAIAVIQDGDTKFFNRRLIELTGCTEEELYRVSLVQLIPAEDRDMVALNYMNRVAGIPAPNNYQFRIIDRRGQTRWLQVSSVRLTWEDRPATLSMFSDVTERVKAEQALRDSEERFRALIEKASDAIIIIGADARVKYYSPSIARATGYHSEDWEQREMADWRLHPDDLARMAPLLEDVLQKPGAIIEDLKIRYKHEDGTWHTLEAMVRNMLHDPRIDGIVANFRDITERVKAEQAVRESEERYRLLAENVSDVIWVTDMNLKPTYVSPSAQRMLGYAGGQLMDGSLESMLTRDSARVALKAFSKALSRESEEPGKLWDTPPLDLEFIRADGSTVWTAANFSYIRGADGKPVAMLGVMKDISERKKAEDSLRRSEERFRSLVETSSDWVWEIDPGNRYTYVSPKVGDILGHDPRDLLGHTPFEFMHQREGRRVSKIMRRFASERLPFSLLENTAIHKDGRAVVLESSAVPIMDSTGRLAGYRGINRDITERKKVEQELQRSLRRLEKTMESTIEAITTTIETRDPYTTGHQMRVTDLACAIARVMQVPPTKIEGIRVAGLLHDIGKIAVPTEILSKPGLLNEVEYEMIKTHPKIGYNILKKIEFPWPVARTVLQHHERWDGSGYPYGIRGEDILLEARILAVADVMEAMSSHRPYRPSIGADKALDEIARNSGVLYDPAVASACIAAFSESGFEFSPTLPGGATAETEVAPAERHVRYSLEDH